MSEFGVLGSGVWGFVSRVRAFGSVHWAFTAYGFNWHDSDSLGMAANHCHVFSVWLKV